jgi:hypothetical protein
MEFSIYIDDTFGRTLLFITVKINHLPELAPDRKGVGERQRQGQRSKQKIPKVHYDHGLQLRRFFPLYEPGHYHLGTCPTFPTANVLQVHCLLNVEPETGARK